MCCRIDDSAFEGGERCALFDQFGIFDILMSAAFPVRPRPGQPILLWGWP
jgi:hypothetical protein